MLFEFDELASQRARIKVLGIGGAGGNAINRMITSGMDGVEFIAINTDAQDLGSNPAETKLQIGKDLTKGLGAGAKPDIGRKAIMHDKDAVASLVAGADLVFVTAGMGGGTGTGAAPVVAKVCKDLGILTVCIVTLPFTFEGSKKMESALKGVASMRNFCDTLIIVPNQKLLSVVDNATTFEDGFKESDAILLQAAKSISDLINKQGNVNIDFADVESVMSGMGDAVIGAGTARGEERAVLAAQQAICSPLLDSQSISGAKAVLVNITGNKKMTLLEVDAAMKLIHEEAGQGVKVIFGVRVDENMEDELQVTVIATGFNRKPIEEKEMLKERMSHSSDRKSEELMDTPNTTLYQKNNPEGFEFDDSVRDEDDGSDGPTLVFDDFDQSQDLEVPAYIRKQR
ncbi:MAG: cell division protein FtsZ [Candidatus Marinimicrobia bacterium]|jgi:cell division protein FtsZ|nr:cell division protein FtsZ [Candidatus Neomarinimicrobiota bacterium]MBT3728387.1 cell division protein FtsZ [Candidatus Neomarinimicrobiota bacterium]MBT3944027.1 cell division protein FtsZ [Candidatus Neomarinimicrobiota bacterium]MBT4111751.1 cell division protein FtsZ [Candidatus Neomarinimicrobiota bacterium]MBT4317248.1 cell division protein FtsZ [Candidatus Neomarinimicrobiota bacterium]